MAGSAPYTYALSLYSPSSWTYQCIETLINNQNNSIIRYVDQHGSLLPGFQNGITWGVTRDTCDALCNSNVIPLVSLNCQSLLFTLTIRKDFSFPSFAASFTNFLLPWLGYNVISHCGRFVPLHGGWQPFSDHVLAIIDYLEPEMDSRRIQEIETDDQRIVLKVPRSRESTESRRICT